MPANFDVLSFFRFMVNFELTDPGFIVRKTYIFIISNLYLTKTENRTKKPSTQVLFLPKNSDFSQNKC